MPSWLPRSSLVVLGAVLVFGTGVYFGRSKTLRGIEKDISALKSVESSVENMRVTPERTEGSPTPASEGHGTSEESEKCIQATMELAVSVVNAGDQRSDENAKALAYLRDVNSALSTGKSFGFAIEKEIGLPKKDDDLGDYASYVRTHFAALGPRVYEIGELQCPEDLWPSLLIVMDKATQRAFAVLSNRKAGVVALSDLDSDGKIELLAEEWNGGNCWACDSQHLYRIQDGRIREVSLEGHGIQGIVEPKDKNARGVTFEVLDTSWEYSLAPRSHAEGIGLTRYIRVNGERIAEVTPEYKEEILKEFPYKDDPEATLLVYETIGERQRGMEMFEKEYAEKIRQAPDPGSQILYETILNEFRRQHRSGKRFQPFNTDGKDKVYSLDSRDASR